jgi:hypothetical protein
MGEGREEPYVEVQPGKAHMEWSSVVGVGGESERRTFYTTVSSRTDRPPCRMVDDILLALINLSRRSGGFEEEIRTSRYEILSQMSIGANEPGGDQYKALNWGFEHLSVVVVETNFTWMPEKDFWFSPYARGCTHRCSPDELTKGSTRQVLHCGARVSIPIGNSSAERLLRSACSHSFVDTNRRPFNAKLQSCFNQGSMRFSRGAYVGRSRL